MEPVADVYLTGPQAGKSLSYTTLPGKVLAFRGGAARVFDEREMPWVLRHPDMEVTPAPRYLDFLPTWMNRCGESDPPRARLSLPEGLEVAGTPTQYRLHVVEPGDCVAGEQSLIGWDVADTAVCPICEQPFQRVQAAPHISPQKYCGPECRAEAARQYQAERYQQKKAAKLAASGG